MKRFIWPIRVYYEDTDAGGVVYHANYLQFFERARTEMLRAMGFEQDSLNKEYGIIFAVRSIAVDYLLPAKFNEHLQIDAEITTVKPASMVFTQSVNRDASVLCKATVRIACLHAETLRPQLIPEHLLVRLKHEC
ncbi:MAG: tol-pal system-associated acyl-CoA thioesterase [Gammaproteobacteria bacterium]